MSFLKRIKIEVEPYYLTSHDRLATSAIFMFFIIFYLLTLCPTVNVAGDSPELIAACRILGIPHPPGYPLYVLLGRVFLFFPLGSSAWRLNFLSSIYHALTLSLLYVLTVKVVRRSLPSLLAIIALGCSYLFWQYSLVAEVFPLNNLFAVALLLLLILARERLSEGNDALSRRYIYLFAFVLGLSFTHHQTIVLLLPSLFLLALDLFPPISRPRWRILLTACFFLLGLLPFLYLPIRASMRPYINVGDPSNLSNFVKVVTRSSYGTTSLWYGPTAESRLDLFFDFTKTLGQELTIFGLFIGIVGMVSMARHRKGYFWVFGSGLFMTAFVFTAMANVKITGIFFRATIERFYLLPTILFIPFFAQGIYAIADAGHWFIFKGKDKDYSKVYRFIIFALLSLIIVIPFYSNFKYVNMSADYIGESYISNLFLKLPDNAVLLTSGDVTDMLTDYYLAVEGKRKDVTAVNIDYATAQWYREELRSRCPQLVIPEEDRRIPWLLSFIRENLGKADFFINYREVNLTTEYLLMPKGISFQILPLDHPYNPSSYWSEANEIWNELDLSGTDLSLYRDNRRESEVIGVYGEFLYHTGNFLSEAGRPDLATGFYYRAIVLDSRVPIYFKKFAQALEASGMMDQAIEVYNRYANSPIGEKEANEIFQLIEDLENSK